MVEKPNTEKRSLYPWLNLLPDSRMVPPGMETPPQQDCVTSDIGSYIQYNRTIEGDDDLVSEDFCPDHTGNTTPPSATKPTLVRSVRSHISSRGYRPSVPSVLLVSSNSTSNHTSSNTILTSNRSTCPSTDSSRPMTDMEYYLHMPEMNGRYPRFSINTKHASDSSSCGCCSSNTTGRTSYCSTNASYADRHTGFLPASLDIPHVVPATTRFALDDGSAGTQPQPHPTPTPTPQITASFGGSDGSSDDPKMAVEKANLAGNTMDQKKYTFLQCILFKLLPFRWRMAATTTTTTTTSSLNARAPKSPSFTLDDDSDIDLTYVAKTDEENQIEEEMRKEWWFRQKIQALVLVFAIALVIAGVGVALYYTTTSSGPL